MLSTLIEYFGLTKYSQMSKNLRDFEKAIEELKNSNTILNFYAQEIKQDRPRVKVVDYKISIQPHPEFITEVKKGSHRKNLIESQVRMMIEDENAPNGFIGSMD